MVITGGKSRDAGKWMDDICDNRKGYICQTLSGESTKPHLPGHGGLSNVSLNLGHFLDSYFNLCEPVTDRRGEVS